MGPFLITEEWWNAYNFVMAVEIQFENVEPSVIRNSYLNYIHVSKRRVCSCATPKPVILCDSDRVPGFDHIFYYLGIMEQLRVEAELFQLKSTSRQWLRLRFCNS